MVKHSRRFWVTGASNGLGLAVVERLLEQGHRVAASSKDSDTLDNLAVGHGQSLLRLPGHLPLPELAEAAHQQIADNWGALDVLIVNAGTCDYLSHGLPADELFEAIASTNLTATEQCLGAAMALLEKGDQPQVMAVFSRYSAVQLHTPSQGPNAGNCAPQWVRLQRPGLKERGIDLTVVAPQSLKAPVAPVPAIPEPWTAQTAAEELLRRLPQREAELVLEVLEMQDMWPLPD